MAKAKKIAFAHLGYKGMLWEMVKKLSWAGFVLGTALAAALLITWIAIHYIPRKGMSEEKISSFAEQTSAQFSDLNEKVWGEPVVLHNKLRTTATLPTGASVSASPDTMDMPINPNGSITIHTINSIMCTVPESVMKSGQVLRCIGPNLRRIEYVLARYNKDTERMEVVSP